MSNFVTIALLAISPLSILGDFQSSSTITNNLILAEQTQIVVDEGAAKRVMAAETLRTLSQEIPAAACNLHEKVDTQEAGELLRASVAQFDSALLALRDGDEAHGIIGAEPVRRIQMEIDHLIAEWHPIHNAALAVLDDPDNMDAINVVYSSTDTMLQQTYHLLSEIEAEYSNPVELLQSDMMLLEVSGRMAMMTQRLAYESCRAWSSDYVEEYLEDLAQTMGQFEAGMNGLAYGLPALDIHPAPTPEIAAKLEDISADWTTIRGHLETILDGIGLTQADCDELYHLLAAKLHKVEDLEHLYQVYAERRY